MNLISKVTIVLASLLVLAGCASVRSTRPSDTLSCAEPEGYEYTCFTDSVCMEYMKGYGALIRERFRAQEKSGWYPGVTTHVVHVNLFIDHRDIYFIGRMEAEKIDGKIFQKVWMMVCDLENNVLEEAYTEGFQGEEPKEEVWPK